MQAYSVVCFLCSEWNLIYAYRTQTYFVITYQKWMKYYYVYVCTSVIDTATQNCNAMQTMSKCSSTHMYKSNGLCTLSSHSGLAVVNMYRWVYCETAKWILSLSKQIWYSEKIVLVQAHLTIRFGRPTRLSLACMHYTWDIYIQHKHHHHQLLSFQFNIIKLNITLRITSHN